MTILNLFYLFLSFLCLSKVRNIDSLVSAIALFIYSFIHLLYLYPVEYMKEGSKRWKQCHNDMTYDACLNPSVSHCHMCVWKKWSFCSNVAMMLSCFWQKYQIMWMLLFLLLFFIIFVQDLKVANTKIMFSFYVYNTVSTTWLSEKDWFKPTSEVPWLRINLNFGYIQF